jgi:type III protein arginine methyltransferase
MADGTVENHDVVSEALRKARYNEIVHVIIEQDDEVDVSLSNSRQHEICLVPRLNEQQGGIQFMSLMDLLRNQGVNRTGHVLSNKELVLQKELQTKQWFFPMLNDHRRNDLYCRAIAAAIQRATRNDALRRAQNSEISVLKVLDIGSGSGLLSMMVAEYCNTSKPPIPFQVTSVEMSSAFSFMATQTIKENHFTEDMICIQHGQHSMSTTFNQTNRMVFDVCLSELFDDGLLGEGWIPSVRDAWKRHLSPHAVIVPSGAQIFASLVQAEWLLNSFGPDQFRFNCLDGSQRHVVMSISSNQGSEQLIGARHAVLPINAEKLIRDGSLALLSDAIPVFSFDVSSLHSIPEPEGRMRIVPITISMPGISKNANNSDLSCGIAHGVLLWWEMNLWDHSVVYSTEPGKEPWQDHWHPCLHVFDHAINVAHDQTIEVAFHHDDQRVFVDLLESPLLFQGTECHKRVKRDSESTNNFLKNSLVSPALISTARVFLLNDVKRLNVFQRSLEYALLSQKGVCKESSPESLDAIILLDVSDFALGGLIVASMMATNPLVHCPCKVVSLENSSSNLPAITTSIADENIGKLGSNVNFEVLQCYNESISLDLIGESPVHILFSEPYSEVLEGCHLQEALNFYYTVRLLRTNGILSDKTIVLPNRCRLLGCIIESGQLRSAYARCGGSESESISGLQHKYVNRIGYRFHEYDLCIPMWQYDYVTLSDPFELGVLQYASPNAPPFPEETTIKAPFHSAGQCDALLVWLEYSFAPLSGTTFANYETALISTNSQPYNQMIRILDDSTKCLMDLDNFDKYEVVCTSIFGGNGMESHQFTVSIQIKS